MIATLAAELPTKNGWTLAEHGEEDDPHGVHHLLGRAVWDEDAAAGALRGFVAEHLGADDEVFVGDETGDLKKGTRTVGTQRQYTGTAGRTENAQVAVYLGYASDAGHALVDRELYLPASWTEQPDRCEQAGVPGDVAFATKPTLLGDMVERAVTAGVPGHWVAGDEVYGNNPKLARRVEDLGLGYVLAVATNRKVPITATTSRTASRTASRVAADLPKRSWQRRSVGAGAHGQRYYEWALVDLHPRITTKPGSPPRRAVDGGGTRGGAGRPTHSRAWQGMVEGAEHDAAQSGRRWWLLVRRHPRTGEQAYYLCFAPAAVSLGELVKVAGRRWTIEESFQASKGLTGLDEHQVRRWGSWRRWTLLVMCAHAVLSVATLTACRRDRQDARRQGLVPLTCAEIRRLVAAAARTAVDGLFTLAWSRWRRHHQMRAKVSHYARRGDVLKIK